MKAIETQYKGYRFRSRLEARWAVFYDALGIVWRYESEGFDLGKMGWYLPDFYIPHLDCFIEIKPEPDEEAGRKCAVLAQQSGKFVFMFFSDLCPFGSFRTGRESEWPHFYKYRFDGSNWYYSPDRSDAGSFERDGGTNWGYCIACEQFCIGHFGHHNISYDGADEKYKCPFEDKIPKDYQPGNHPKILRAYEEARSARFEHGETPNIQEPLEEVIRRVIRQEMKPE